jgi:hypothetical protein
MTAAGSGWRVRRSPGWTLALASLLLATACGSGGDTKSKTEAGSAQPSGASAPSVAKTPGCPTKPVVFSAPSAWQRIGQVPSSGATDPEPIWEATLKVTNTGSADVNVATKALIETDRPMHDYATGSTAYSPPMIVGFGPPRAKGGNRLDGKDIDIVGWDASPVPAGRTVELVARASAVVQAKPLETRVLYGRGSLVAKTADETARCEIPIEGAQPLRLLDGAPVRGEVSKACPEKPVRVTAPSNWKMTNNFSGQQTWEGTATITNPNAVDVSLATKRSFALVQVTRADGSSYVGYTSPFRFRQPSSGGVILAGQTVEVSTEGKFVRPSMVATTQTFVDVRSPTGNCAVAVEGAQPPTAAARGPRLCADGIETDLPPYIDVGRRQVQDNPACV